MAAPTVVQSANNTASGTIGTVTVTLGATPTAGNHLFGVLISLPGTGTSPNISGFQTRRAAHQAARKVSFFSRPVVGGMSTAVVFNFLGIAGQRVVAIVFEVNGASDDTIPWIWTEASTTTGSSQTIPSVTPLAGLDCLLIAVAGANDAQGITTPPSGYTLIQQNAIAPGGASYRLATYYKAVTNPSGSYSSTIVYAGGLANFHGLHLVIAAPQVVTTCVTVQSGGAASTVVGNAALTVVLGASPTPGNMLIATFMSQDSTTPSGMSGWTALITALATGASPTNQYGWVWVKEATPGESATIAITFPSTNPGKAFQVREVVGTYLTEAHGVVVGPSQDVHQAVGSVTPNAGKQTGLVAIGMWDSSQPWAVFPVGYFDIVDTASSVASQNNIKIVSGLRVIRSPSGSYDTDIAVGSAALGMVKAHLTLQKRSTEFVKAFIIG